MTMEPNRRHRYELPAQDRAFVHVLSGAVRVAGRAVRTGQIAWSEPVARAGSSSLELVTGDGARPSVAMIWSGQPIGEPVVMGGPFVMNSNAEIARAFRDFHAGGFGEVPGRARLA